MNPLPPHAKVPTGCEKFPARILVVDGEALIRWSLCAALAANGFEAVGAEGPAEAMRLAAEEPRPCVILIDLRWPDADSLQVLAATRAICPGCRFIIMTTMRDKALRLLLQPRDELIQKPFDLEQMVRLVRSLVPADQEEIQNVAVRTARM